MGDPKREEWLALYHSALLELEHARKVGRIQDTRIAIVARLEKLQEIDGLHARERQALSDAIMSLRVLEREEAEYQAEQKQRVLDEALENLRAIGPSIKRLADDAEADHPEESD